MKIKLTKPFEVEVGGKKDCFTELDIPLEEMTGADVLALETQLQSEGKLTVMGDFSKQYQLRLAARALKIPHQTLERLPLKDFNRVVMGVQAFLLPSDSGEEGTPETEDVPKAEAESPEVKKVKTLPAKESVA